MSTRIVVMPTGDKATPEAIAKWKAAAQAVADKYDMEAELIGRRPDGTVESHIIAEPARPAETPEPGEASK